MKRPKTPVITDRTRILCFDLETNGLHGDAFALGAVVVDASGKIHSQFVGRSEITGPVDDWVKDNVLPVIGDISIKHHSAKSLRDAFWQWYVPAETDADYVVVCNGYPVEYRFLLQCQEDNLDQRYWQHPFPILDLASLLIQVGESVGKSKVVNTIIADGGYSRHHPLHDAIVTALAAFEAFRLAGKIE